MPWGYLITVALVAICTFAAVRPFGSPRGLGRHCWMLGMIPNELPFVVVSLLAAATLVAGLQGDLDSTVGVIALAVAIVTTACLAIIVARATQTARVVDHALLRDLGTKPRTKALPMLRILLAPFTVTRHDVRRIPDVPYREGGRQNTLDLYVPRSQPTRGPMLVHFHGGGYRSGSKSRESRVLLHRLARAGWLCASANYGLRPDATFADSLQDANEVVQWLRGYAHEHGILVTDIFVAGSSAGGHLALTTALADPSIAGAISFYAYYGEAEAD